MYQSIIRYHVCYTYKNMLIVMDIDSVVVKLDLFYFNQCRYSHYYIYIYYIVIYIIMCLTNDITWETEIEIEQ